VGSVFASQRVVGALSVWCRVGHTSWSWRWWCIPWLLPQRSASRLAPAAADAPKARGGGHRARLDGLVRSSRTLMICRRRGGRVWEPRG
jgi:hypothetical protein